MVKAKQMSIFDYKEKYTITKPIRLIELFAGIGSQSKALNLLGTNFEHYRIIEFDKYAVKSYNAVHGTNFETSDITQMSATDLNIVETDNFDYIMTYSFPCQDLSLAGNGKGMEKWSGTRSGLLWEVERLLDECDELPQILLMENVPNIVGKKNIDSFLMWFVKLEKLGYNNHYQMLNAKDYGIPQNRNRCFMVSILGNYGYSFPQKQPLTVNLGDFLKDSVDKKYYNCTADEAERLSRTYKNISQRLNNSGAEFFRHTSNQSVDFMRFPLPNLSRAIRAGNASACVIHLRKNEPFSKKNIRKLTSKECWRLMGFLDSDFDKVKQVGISNTQLYKQAGNSIVVNVLVEIFRELLED